MVTCSSCKHENPEDAKFCLSCGATLKGDPSPATTASPSGGGEAKPPVKVPATSAPAAGSTRAWWQNWRCCGAACLVALLVLLIGVPLLHTLVIRPPLQDAILIQIRAAVDKNIEPPGQKGGFNYNQLSEKKLNEALEVYWRDIPGANNGQVRFDQDLITVEVSVYGLQLQFKVDIRVDDEGDILIKSLSANWVVHLFLTDDGLKKALTDYINVDYLGKNKIKFLAFQVTDSKIFVAYTDK